MRRRRGVRTRAREARPVAGRVRRWEGAGGGAVGPRSASGADGSPSSTACGAGVLRETLAGPWGRESACWGVFGRPAGPGAHWAGAAQTRGRPQASWGGDTAPPPLGPVVTSELGVPEVGGRRAASAKRDPRGGCIFFFFIGFVSL